MRSQLKLAACAVALFVVAASSVAAAGQKKWKVKEKHFEPVARQNVQEYAGHYVGIDESYRIDLRVGDDGQLTGACTEGERAAALTDIRVEGATLTATRVYSNGRRAQIVATFADRVLNGDREFGLLVENMRIELPGLTTTRVFYRRVAE